MTTYKNIQRLVAIMRIDSTREIQKQFTLSEVSSGECLHASVNMFVTSDVTEKQQRLTLYSQRCESVCG